MKHLIRLLLFIVLFASVCSLDRSVPDCAIMGKWLGAGGAVLVSILVVSITLNSISKCNNWDVDDKIIDNFIVMN